MENENTLSADSKSGSSVINVSKRERYVSAIAGAMLLSSAFKNFGKKPGKSFIKAIAGGFLLYRGASGNCVLYNYLDNNRVEPAHASSINIRTTLVVNRPRQEVYAFWRQLENLPLFMRHLQQVTQVDDRHSIWEASFPADFITLKWEAEIVKEIPGELLAWQSREFATIENAGKVEFSDALGGRGTELSIMISYRLPAGDIGSKLGGLFNPIFERKIKEDLLQFKSYIEADHSEENDLVMIISEEMQ